MKQKQIATQSTIHFRYFIFSFFTKTEAEYNVFDSDEFEAEFDTYRNDKLNKLITAM
ncbi:MAG: hypothetical protein GY755_14375 [Chloroflexi bacterium]|nr:hypothetical protein [Chloroflexota bacterium]